MEPLLSVIVPIYNVEQYLRKCVDSILCQTYRNLEVILVDDGSPDGCGAICDEYDATDGRVKVIHKINGGLSDARNAGLDAASGEYITFVDSDDWISEDLYQNAMVRIPFSVLVFGCTDVYAKTGTKRVKNVSTAKATLRWDTDNCEIQELCYQSLLGYACNKIYHREILDQIRFQNVKLREDLLFNIEVFARTKKLYVLDQSGYFYYHRDSSLLTGCFHGAVPDIAGVAERLTVVHPDLCRAANRRVANHLVKTYLTDAMYKFVFKNSELSASERIEAIKTVNQSKIVRKCLRFYASEGKLFFILTLSYKLRWSGLLYHILKRIWKQ